MRWKVVRFRICSIILGRKRYHNNIFKTSAIMSNNKSCQCASLSEIIFGLEQHHVHLEHFQFFLLALQQKKNVFFRQINSCPYDTWMTQYLLLQDVRKNNRQVSPSLIYIYICDMMGRRLIS